MIDGLLRLIEQLQATIFLGAAQPALYELGLMDWSEDVFDSIEFALFGAIEIILAYLLFRPLELWRPVERWQSRRAVRTDIVYSLVSRLGIVPAIIFLLLAPIGATIDGTLRYEGYIPPTLEQLIPPLRAWPFVTFLLYIAVIDLAEYWRHRLQHWLPWWWALHSIHHDQRQMTLWSDDRNHLLDDVLTSVWRGTIAMLIGIAPAEYPLVMIGFRLVESLSHTNVRVSLGWIGKLVLVGPQYHRLHHAIEHARAPFDRTMGCNFAVILPVWDILFRTWRRDRVFPATGVAGLTDSAVSGGYVSHQIEGFRRFGAVVARWFDGRRPGFAAGFEENRRSPPSPNPLADRTP